MSTLSPAAAPPVRHGPFTGFIRLLRLQLRLDRIHVPVWVASFLILVWGSVVALETAYPEPESLQARALLLNNPAAIMMTGPLFGVENYTFGAMVANELSLYTFLPAAIMGVIYMSRHSRAEEESGRLEMLRALPIGRFAPPTAASAMLFILSLLVGAATTAGLVFAGLPMADSLAFGLGTTLTALVFAAVTGVIAHLSTSAGSTTGMGLALVALAYFLRGAGDVIEAQGSWLSWFSPFAWAQQTRLFVELRWWPLLIPVVVIMLLTALSFRLATIRDLGSGLTPARPGRAHAPVSRLSPAGLALRLQRGTFLWWTLGLFFFALGFGMLSSEVEGMLDEIPAVSEFIDLDLADLTRSFGAVMLSMLALGPAALLTAGVLGLRREEAAGRAAALIHTGSSRPVLLLSWCGTVAALTLLMQVLLGAGVGAGMALAGGDLSWISTMLLAGLAHLPAIMLHGALAACCLGFSRRWALLGWVPVGWTALVVFLGGILGLPDRASALSPFWHTPAVPAVDIQVLPLLLMSALIPALLVVALLAYRRRDITEG